MMKRYQGLILWSLVAVFVLTAAYITYIKRDTQPEIKQQENRVEAPDFVLNDLEGNSVKLSDFRGKIVFLNFWATWCSYCVGEMPELEKAHNALNSEGDAVILTINIQETPVKIKNFMSDMKLSLRTLIDADGIVASRYGVKGIPITFIINKDGTIYNYMGVTTAETILNLVKNIKNN